MKRWLHLRCSSEPRRFLMEFKNNRRSCRLGRRPDKQGPRCEFSSGIHSDKSATTNSCSKCGKVYIRKDPLMKHQASCSANSPKVYNYKCLRCGKKYNYKTCLEKHQKRCAPDPTPMTASQSSPLQQVAAPSRYKINRSRYPDRLKVIVWKAIRGNHSSKEIIRSVRKDLEIDKSIHVFTRGKKQRKRVELWFKDRNSALSAYDCLRQLCKVKKLGYFCSIGRNYSERHKKTQSKAHRSGDSMTIFTSPSTPVRGQVDSIPPPTPDKGQEDFTPQSTTDQDQVDLILASTSDPSPMSAPDRRQVDHNPPCTGIPDQVQPDSCNDFGIVRILQWNTQSITNKADELRLLLHEWRIDIACISETRISDSEKWRSKFKDFTLHNFARPNKEGGGVCLLVRNKCGITNFSTFYSEILEYITADITVAQDLTLSISSIYARNGCQRMTTELNSCVRGNHSLICGDFNAKHSLWGSTKTNSSGSKLLEWSLDNDLIILNDDKQHTFQCHSTGATDSMDVSLASPRIADRVTQWRVLDDALGSDHFPIVMSLEYQNNTKPSTKIPRWNIAKADRELFKAVMSVSALDARDKIQEDGTDIDAKVNILTSCIVEAAEQSYSVSKPRKRPPAPWWNDDIAKARSEKRKARRCWKMSNTLGNKIKFKKQQAYLRRCIKEAKRSSWREFVSSINRDTPSSVVWKKIKAINGITQSGPAAIAYDQRMVTDEEEQANLFGSYYASKCTVQEPQVTQNHFSDSETRLHDNHDLLCDLEDPCDQAFTPEELDLALSELTNSATGADRIHNQMLKDLPEAGKSIVLSVVNDLWEEGSYPSEWKISKIIPLLKPNKDKQEMKSYRPVALTSCLGKLAERMINRRLTWRLHQDDILHHSQCGFRPKSGTIDALLKITEMCHKGLHQKSYTILIFIDLEGAFDKVWWDGLITKAASVGIAGNMLQALRNFLSDRYIQVQVGDQSSEKFNITAGTPQGAVISPTIFNIMMYDLPSIIPELSTLATFADDGTMGLTHSDLLYLVRMVNKFLDAVDKWAQKWKLKLSRPKTEYTVITKKRKHVKPLDELDLVIQGERISYNKNPKSLGLILDPRLTWKAHIDSLVDQCTRRLNLMKVIASKSWGADFTILRTFYIAFIRSKITYAAEVWSSCCRSQLDRLCRIQNFALRLITGALKTTPVAAMEIETDIIPLDLFIDSIILKKRISCHFMPDNSPGKLQRSKAPLSFYQRSKRLLHDRKIHLPHKCEASFAHQAIVNSIPPWEWSPPDIHLSLPTNPSKSESPETLLQQLALEIISEDYKDFVTVYTDGSLNASAGVAGAGIYIPTEDIEVILPLPPCSILNAELLAIQRALQEIQALPSASHPENRFVILTDSKSSLQTLENYKPSEYYHLCLSIYELIKNIPGKITLQWIPSHVGIGGNERADILAKLASESGPVNKPSESLPSLLCMVRKTSNSKWSDRWHSGTTGRVYHSIQPGPNTVRFKNISRSDQVTLSRLRMQHFPTQSFLFRFNLVEDATCLLCGDAEETVDHLIFKCPELAEQRTFSLEQELGAIFKNQLNEWSSLCQIVKERQRRIHARASLPDA